MGKGFAKAHRELIEHPLFVGRADRLGAWLWLFTMAAWKPTRHDVNGKTVTVNRGQLCASYRQMADAWGWSLGAVQRFLTRLKTDTMIETQADTGKMIITICNYDKYQDDTLEADTPSDTPSDTRAIHDRYTKEESKNNSVTYVTGANAPERPLSEIIFGPGLRLLTGSGVGEKQARSLLGKWRKEQGDETLLAALGRAQREGAIDPVSFVTGCFKASRKAKGKSDDKLERFARLADCLDGGAESDGALDHSEGVGPALPLLPARAGGRD